MRNLNAKKHAMLCMIGAQLLCFEGVKSQSTYAFNSSTNRALTRTEKIKEKIAAENAAQKQKLFAVLKQLNEAKGVYFLFSEKSLGEKMVNPMESSTSVEKMLVQILKNTGLTFKKVNEKTFVILSSKQQQGVLRS